MRLYADMILPWLLDRVMAQPAFAAPRAAFLADVHGTALEIGFGSGANVPYYPLAVQRLIAIDSHHRMLPLARQRIMAAPFPVVSVTTDAQQLALADNAFETVISSWTLCSIPHPQQALREVERVLTPGGRFLFFEHGLSPSQRVQSVQHLLTPLQKRLAGGCHLNRDISRLVEQSGLRITQLDRFFLPDLPAYVGYMYRGVAIKA